MQMADQINLLPQPKKLRRFPGTAEEIEPKYFSDSSLGSQTYRLLIEPNRTIVTSGDAAGAFYANQTLLQLARQFPHSLPCLEIEDSPDFPVRGVMLDISRDKVPTMQTLFDLIDQLAESKINQLQLYMEHTFAYSKHQTVWKYASPI